MQKFSFSKNKKSIFFVFIFFCVLFLAVFWVLFPVSASAQTTTTFNISDSCSTPQGQAAAIAAGNNSNQTKDLGFLYNIAVGIAWAILSMMVGALRFTLNFFHIISTTILDKKITSGFAVDIWNSVKNVADMAIVLGFVIVGISTSLRIKDYEAKKLLWPLILAALLINFSGLFCGLIIDASNIIASGLSGPGATAYDGISSISNILACASNSMTNTAWDAGDGGILLQAIGVSITIFVIWFFAIFVAIATFLQRYIMLILLYILSPLAFAAWIFPASKKLWAEWWNNFLKWCFIGVGLYFSFWLAAKTLTAGEMFSDITLRTFIAVCFIIIGVRATTKKSGLAAMASTAVIGLATGGAGLAMGAATRVGGAALERAGRTNTGRAIREAVGNRLAGFQEATGLAGEGHQNNVRTRRREEYKNVAKGMTDDQVNNELTGTGGRGSRGAAFFEEATSRKIIGRGRTNQQIDTLLANAQESGSPTIRKDAEKLIPALGVNNHPAVARIIGQPNRATGVNFTAADAPREVVRRNHAGMSFTDVRDINEHQMTPQMLEDVNSRTFESATQRFKTEQTDHVRDMVADYNNNPANPLRTRRRAMLTEANAQRVAGNIDGADYILRQRANLGRNIRTARTLQ